jgi:AGCS family alanine or glycine:cation symporter
MEELFEKLTALNSYMLGETMLKVLLGVGVLFTLWSGFGQFRSLTHGLRLVAGKVPGVSGSGSGVLSHFQALSAALSATVGLGNIGGVAIAVSLGGPGAVFWMWVVGFVGMALKTTEVTLSMLYRNTDDPANPHGGTMWVAKKGLGALLGPHIGALIGGLFAVALIAFGLTGGNMFQAWNVANITEAYFGVTPWVSGLIMAAIVAAVILGGIRRIGTITGLLVPFMCGLYLLSGLYVLSVNADRLPEVLRLIFRCAFAPAEAVGAFTGAAAGTGFIFGMRRALFSSEAGLGSAPIAHSAVKTPEPATEGIVAGLEPFIDTVVVCSITALVILVSGTWNRGPVATWDSAPTMVHTQQVNQWQPSAFALPARTDEGVFIPGEQVFVVVEVDGQRQRLYGHVGFDDSGLSIDWRPLYSVTTPVLAEAAVFEDLPASTLTAKAFDTAHPGLGRWMVTLTVWLFAISTLITWSYYGEQGVVYLLGNAWVMPYRIVWCGVIAVTCLGFIRTDAEIDTLSTVALGFMLAINLPTMVLLGSKAMAAQRDYFRRLKRGELGQNRP